MNEFVYKALDSQINPGKYTKEQLRENYLDADAAEYWLNKYFNETGESKKNYINAINKDNNNEY